MIAARVIFWKKQISSFSPGLKVLQWLPSSQPTSMWDLPVSCLSYFHLIVGIVSISSSISRPSGTHTPPDSCSPFPSLSWTTVFHRPHNFEYAFPSNQNPPGFITLIEWFIPTLLRGPFAPCMFLVLRFNRPYEKLPTSNLFLSPECKCHDNSDLCIPWLPHSA